MHSYRLLLCLLLAGMLAGCIAGRDYQESFAPIQPQGQIKVAVLGAFWAGYDGGDRGPDFYNNMLPGAENALEVMQSRLTDQGYFTILDAATLLPADLAVTNLSLLEEKQAEIVSTLADQGVDFLLYATTGVGEHNEYDWYSAHFVDRNNQATMYHWQEDFLTSSTPKGRVEYASFYRKNWNKAATDVYSAAEAGMEPAFRQALQ